MIDPRAERLNALLAAIPYVRFLGMEAEIADGVLTARLPYAPRLIGNASLPALHGGVLGAFMELTALATLAVREPDRKQPRTIDVTIEYLRTGRPELTHARADLRRVGRRIASVSVEAWQTDAGKPVAALRGHFMLGERVSGTLS